jgi:serine/threonine-protein kinase RsbW
MKMIARRIVSRIENVAPLLKEALVVLEGLPFPPEEIFSIKLSLEEALTNAMRHGNKLDPALSVDVALTADDEKIVIKVKDEGAGFDARHLHDPTSGENTQKPGGRGVFLMKRLMDRVEYFDGGRGIEMVKFFKK